MTLPLRLFERQTVKTHGGGGYSYISMYFNDGTKWRYDVSFNPRRLNPDEGVPGLYLIGRCVHTRAVLGPGKNRHVH